MRERERDKGEYATYLDEQVEPVQIPELARDDVLVDQGHTDGRQTVCQDGDAGVVLQADQGARRAAITTHLVGGSAASNEWTKVQKTLKVADGTAARPLQSAVVSSAPRMDDRPRDSCTSLRRPSCDLRYGDGCLVVGESAIRARIEWERETDRLTKWQLFRPLSPAPRSADRTA